MNRASPTPPSAAVIAGVVGRGARVRSVRFDQDIIGTTGTTGRARERASRINQRYGFAPRIRVAVHPIPEPDRIRRRPPPQPARVVPRPTLIKPRLLVPLLPDVPVPLSRSPRSRNQSLRSSSSRTGDTPRRVLIPVRVHVRSCARRSSADRSRVCTQGACLRGTRTTRACASSRRRARGGSSLPRAYDRVAVDLAAWWTPRMLGATVRKR